MTIPKHLVRPDQNGRLYGKLTFDPQRECFVIEAGPEVLERAKRTFPGCRIADQTRVAFKASTRVMEDLNWLLLRFPLQIDDMDLYDRQRVKAIEHALRRETNQAVGPMTPPPTFVGELKDYQKEGLAFMVANERSLLADDMGLGKTPTGLAATAAVDGFPALCVVPANVQLQWQRQVGVFLNLPTPGQQALITDPAENGRRMTHIIRGLKPYDLPKVPIYIIHYGLLSAWKRTLPEIGFRAVLFDEAQELRRSESDKYSAASIIAEVAKWVWGLSGTPIYNYGGEIWNVLNIIQFHCLGGRDAFRREWGKHYASDEIKDPEVLGAYLRREGLMLRRTKAEVQSQLPAKRRIVHVVDKDDSQYHALVKKAMELADGYGDIKDWAKKGQTKRLIDTETRQATGIAKAPYVAAFVRSLLEAGERVLLYAHHHAVHEILAEKLREFKPVRVTGEETPKEKEEAKAAFAEKRTPLIQLALRSTAGLDRLQEAGTCVVFAELDWSPLVHAQGEDRLQRIGVDESMESILCYYLVADTGSDEVMQDALGLKIGQFVGLFGDKAPTEADQVLANQAADRHMDKVIQKLRELKAG